MTSLLPRDPSRDRLTGIALMCGAVASFALLDTSAKYLNLHMSTLESRLGEICGCLPISVPGREPLDASQSHHHGASSPADVSFRAAARLDHVQFCCASLSAARRIHGHRVLYAVYRCCPLRRAAWRVGALATVERHCGWIRGSPRGHPARKRQLPAGGAALALRRALLRAVC